MQIFSLSHATCLTLTLKISGLFPSLYMINLDNSGEPWAADAEGSINMEERLESHCNRIAYEELHLVVGWWGQWSGVHANHEGGGYREVLTCLEK